MRTSGYDVIVVGAGSAGCVVAAQLTGCGARVALVEAGPDVPPGRVPRDITDTYPRSYSNPKYMWPGLKVRETPHGRLKPFPQGRIVGGGSTVMGMVALRGLPDDYDGWARMGAEGWAWDHVVTAFRRLEADQDFSGPAHGSEGPVAIRRLQPVDWPPFIQEIAGAAGRLGYRMLEDLNGTDQDGFGPLPITVTARERVSAASAFLTPTVRARPELDLLSDTLCLELLFDGVRCRGVHVVDRMGADRQLLADRVVLCTGAIHTPAILMRAGVGPAAQLRRLGIGVVSDLPGIGASLANHPVLYLAAHLKPPARQRPDVRQHFIAALRFSSEMPGATKHDMVLLAMNKSSWRGLGSSIGGLGIGLYMPDSRGTVELASSDPSQPPRVSFGLLSRESDSARMRGGLAVAAELLQDAKVVQTRNEVFTAGYSRIVRELNRPGLLRSIAAVGLGAIVDGPDWLRRTVIRWGVAGGDIGEPRIRTSAWQARTVGGHTFGMYHPAGTCRMGAESDPGAVVSTTGSVYGVSALTVADASIMPRLIRGTTNLPVMMLASRIADSLT